MTRILRIALPGLIAAALLCVSGCGKKAMYNYVQTTMNQFDWVMDSASR